MNKDLFIFNGTDKLYKWRQGIGKRLIKKLGCFPKGKIIKVYKKRLFDKEFKSMEE